MRKLVAGIARLAESIAALMMAAMFGTFLIQIVVRYGARLHLIDPAPFGWTLEFCLVLWLWLVLWGNAFVVDDKDHVTFDILYLAVSPRVRAAFAIIGGVIIAVALLSSIGPTYDKMKILRLKSSATLPVKMFPIYSIYFLFLVVVPLRYLLRAWGFLRRGPGSEGHHHIGITDE